MRLFILLFVIAVACAGCETVHEGARGVGKPIGEATKAIGSISEGANEGYQDTEGDNPFNR